LLSVVVPVFRVEAYLATCLDSILAEGDTALEVVAVDDHSPDGCGAILDEYARRDPRVRVVHLATNVGLGRARNAGLERARGSYVWFVDGDDWLPPGTLPVVRGRLAATRPDVLVLDHVEVWPDGRVRPTSSGPVLRSVAAPLRLAQRPELLGLALATSACTKVIRRDLLEEIDLRFPPGWYEDCAYTYPLLLAARRIDALDRVGYCYRRRPEGAITGSVSVHHFDVFEQYDRMWTRIDKMGTEPDVPPTSPGPALGPELFERMIDHLLVVAGNARRLPARRRREFFGRIHEVYRQRLPAGGYPVPGGMAGFKHWLVRRNLYWVYAALRLVWRATAWLRRRPAASLGAVSVPGQHELDRGTEPDASKPQLP
jgi:CDP-glycerol glycerophosphotransferase